MAVSIVSQPSYPNATYTNLLYTISSNQSGQAQYQYVMDVKQGPNLLSRVKQYPNPNSVAVFNPARILNDYIDYDENWKITNTSSPVSSVQDFTISFGEEYGTSVSSSVELYDGNGNIGAPAVTGTTAEVFAGVVDPNNGISFNWQPQAILSNRPTSNLTIDYDEYETLSLYNDGGLTSVTVNYTPGGSSVYNLTTGFNSIPIAGKNINIPPQWNGITVSVDGFIYNYTASEDCNYQRVRFAFINKLGFWDYYGFNLPIRKTTTMNRQSLTRPMVNYSAAVSSYNVTRRGQDYYNIQYTDSQTVTTPFLSQEEAEWLGELIESPSVYLQEGDNFIPIVMTNGNYVHNTNKRGQKTFQYELTYQYANNRIGR